MPDSLDSLFKLGAPTIYWVVVVIWAAILFLLLRKARLLSQTNRSLQILVFVLAVDAFRTLFENLYFGAFFNAYYGFFPERIQGILASPILIALPKIINVAAGLLILFLLIRRWFPAAEQEHEAAQRALAEQLKQERAKLASETLDNIHDAFIVLDEHARFAFVNRKAMIVLQRNDADLIGKIVWEAFPGLIGTIFETQYRQVTDKRRSVSFTAYFSPADRWLALNVSPTSNGVAVYFKDVTKSRAQEEQLTLLEAAVSRLNDIVIITEAKPIDEPGPRIVSVNNAFTKITGYSRAEVIGKSPRILQGPNTQHDELARIREALKNQKSVRAEVINYTKAGEEYWLEIDIVPIFDGAGLCTHFVGVERDITERKAIEKRLAASEQRFRTVAQATTDFVWDWDILGHNTWRNDPGLAWFGPSANAPLLSPAWNEKIHPEDRDRVLSGLRTAIEGSNAEWDDEYRLLRADGSYAQVVVRGAITRDDAGKAIRIVGSTVDVTEQRHLEEQLRQSQKLDSIGKLTGGVAHDFNNILMVIMANVEQLLDDEYEASNAKRHLERISGAAERATQLTRQLLSFSRKQTLRFQRTNLNDLTAATGALLHRTLGAHIEIDARLADDLWPTDTDRAQVEAALVNLCINARDAMPEGGRLLIETRNISLDQEYVALNPDATAGDYVMLSITDTGSGIPPDVLKKVFEPFFTTKEVGKGTGLGLSMVYGFVKQSKGHVAIYSEVGHGTAVKLYLPRSTQEHATDAADQRTEVLRGTERILLVEDEEQVRAVVVKQLTDLGYAVTAVANGTEALAALGAGQSCDMLLTDVIMPGPFNGKALADKARTLNPALRVLFMSGYSEEAISTLGILNRGVTLISKPFSKAELARAVRAVIETLPTDA